MHAALGCGLLLPTMRVVCVSACGSACVCWTYTTMSCAKAAEPIELPFGTWTRVGPGNHALGGWGASIPARERVVTEHISKTHSLYSSLFSTPVAINNYNNNSDNYNSRKLNYKHLIKNYMLLQNWQKPLAVEIYRNINLSFPLLRIQLGRSVAEQLW